MDNILCGVGVALLLLFVTFALAPAGMRNYNRPTPPKQTTAIVKREQAAIEKRQEQDQYEAERQAKSDAFLRDWDATMQRMGNNRKIIPQDVEVVNGEVVDTPQLGAGRKQLPVGRKRLTG